MARFEPYKVGDKHTIDTDQDDELNYVADVRQWLIDNATTAASFTIESVGVIVLFKGVPQGDMGGLLPAKLKVDYSGVEQAHATFRTKTADGQQFDKTIWFNKVEN